MLVMTHYANIDFFLKIIISEVSAACCGFGQKDEAKPISGL